MNQKRTVYRIAIDARFFQSTTGGVGRYSRELIHRLAQLDSHNHYTIYLTKAGMAEWTLSAANFQPKVIAWDYYTYQEQVHFAAELYKGRYDLVHFLNFNHPILYRRSFVLTLHDLTMYFFPVGRSQKSKIRRLAFIAVLKNAARAAKRIIAVSEYSAHDAEKQLGLSHAKMEVIYEGGPEIPDFPFGNKAMVQDYLGSRDPYFLFVSQWRPHKGILTLIEAFNFFKKQTGASHKLVLVGNQKVSAQEVKEALVSSPYTKDIITPGFVPEEMLLSVFHHATAFIMPSEYEGFGLPPLEAFAAGTPVIVANNSSLPEVAGKAALYFTTRDAHSLADCINQIVADPQLAANLAEKGYKQLKKFSWDKMAQQTLELYYKILEKRR